MTSIFHTKARIALVLGFVLLELLIVVRNWVTDYWVFYWFCDFAPLVFALCLWKRNIQAAKGLMYIGFFGQLIYNISFLSILFSGVPFLGFEIPVTTQPIDSTITFIMHLSAFVVFIITMAHEPRLVSLTYAFEFLIIIYLAVLFFTSPNDSIGFNYNYIYSASALSFIPHYTAFWVPLAFIAVVIPTYLFDRCVFFLLQRFTETNHNKFLFLTI